MKHAIVKGDDYEMTGPEFKENYDDPETKKRPASGDSREGIIKITKSNAPDTGDEFVFCNGKPVVVAGYVFSKLTREEYKREWSPKEEPEPGQPPKPDKDDDKYSEELQSSDVYDITAPNALDFVFIDGVPVCCEDKVSASSKKEVVIDGKVEEAGEKTGDGVFTIYTGHIYG